MSFSSRVGRERGTYSLAAVCLLSTNACLIVNDSPKFAIDPSSFAFAFSAFSHLTQLTSPVSWAAGHSSTYFANELAAALAASSSASSGTFGTTS